MPAARRFQIVTDAVYDRDHFVGQYLSPHTPLHNAYSDAHWVYALLKPSGEAFYIGVAGRPVVRLRQHCWPNSRFRHLLEGGGKMALLYCYSTRQAAEARERDIINRHTHLLNIAGRRTI